MRLRECWRGALIVGALALTLAQPGSTVVADQGVAIDVSAIDISQTLSKGGSYDLPTIGVRNPGDEPTSYGMSITYFAAQEQRRPGDDWFRFEPAAFELVPGATQPVTVVLRIPANADAGDYQALIQASIVADTDGASVGGAAAARVSFSVKPSSLAEAWWRELRDWLGDHAAWVGSGGALALLAILAWMLRRNFRFRLERR